MTFVDTLRESLGILCSVDKVGEGAWVTTTCLYPSNASIRVLVRGRFESFVVSDEAGAVHDVTSSGVAFPDPDRRIRHIVRRHGLKIEDGVVYSPMVPSAALGPVIALVANASKEAAHWGYDHLQTTTSRNFREELARLVDFLVGARVEHDAYLVGASNKPHRFEHVIRLTENRLLVIDPVMNDASSINSRVVAHLDIRNNFQKSLRQRLVYDDNVKWSAADINLLKVGATPLPFNGISDVLPKLVA
jgi:hypothetical protein